MECLYRSFLHLVKIGKFVKQFDLCVLVLTVLLGYAFCAGFL